MRRTTLVFAFSAMLGVGALAASAAETPQDSATAVSETEAVTAPACTSTEVELPDTSPTPVDLAEPHCEEAIDCAAWCQELMPGCFPRCLVGWCDCLCFPDPDL
jgi:hypothetical protein